MKTIVGSASLFIIFSVATPAFSAVLTETFAGTVTDGIDGAGLFGAVGASLVGKSYIAAFTYDTSAGSILKSGNQDYGYQQLSDATSVAFTIGNHTQYISGSVYSNTEHDTFSDYGYRSTDDAGPASLSLNDVYSPVTKSQVTAEIVLKNQSILLDLSMPYTPDLTNGIDSQQGSFSFPGASSELASFARVGLKTSVPAGTSGTFDIQTFSVSFGSGSITPVPLPASAPLFGAALIGLAGRGYTAKRRKAAAV